MRKNRRLLQNPVTTSISSGAGAVLKSSLDCASPKVPESMADLVNLFLYPDISQIPQFIHTLCLEGESIDRRTIMLLLSVSCTVRKSTIMTNIMKYVHIAIQKKASISDLVWEGKIIVGLLPAGTLRCQLLRAIMYRIDDIIPQFSEETISNPSYVEIKAHVNRIVAQTHMLQFFVRCLQLHPDVPNTLYILHSMQKLIVLVGGRTQLVYANDVKVYADLETTIIERYASLHTIQCADITATLVLEALFNLRFSKDILLLLVMRFCEGIERNNQAMSFFFANILSRILDKKYRQDVLGYLGQIFYRIVDTIILHMDMHINIHMNTIGLLHRFAQIAYCTPAFALGEIEQVYAVVLRDPQYRLIVHLYTEAFHSFLSTCDQALDINTITRVFYMLVEYDIFSGAIMSLLAWITLTFPNYMGQHMWDSYILYSNKFTQSACGDLR